ncbi:MAG: NADH-quinone oxidoreductase subunit L [Roseiflexaceae bacterium]
MSLLELAWLIPVCPLLAFLAITFTPLRASRAASGWLAVGLMAVATLLALGVAAQAGAGKPAGYGEGFLPPDPVIVQTFRWAPAGDTALTMGYLIDAPAAAMLVMVTIASTCIHLFSLGYMAHDPRQTRFFSFIALFTAAMLTMVMASNLLLFFMAWELMGLCSYLLIGFWYDRNYRDPRQITPRQAAIKAFITTRIGDVLLMVGMAFLWTEAGSLDFGTAPGQIFNPDLLERLNVNMGGLPLTALTAIALLIFAGTVGKSAQVPLHVWLPDAMEGPTPVSALIHAATMVAAGVFLVARTFPIFEASDALPVVAVVGVVTAVMAALIACAQFDIKRILAYSTLSQLGFMVAALGVGAWVPALFHLLTHAFFKALLFLGAGSVIHGMETVVGHNASTAQDIRNMGGLRRAMPATFLTYMVGFLALAGFPLLAGFWSKDEILAEALLGGHLIIWALLSFASFLTAFYMTRQVVLVFFGEFRGTQPRRDTRPSEPQTVESPRANPHEDEVGVEHPHGGALPPESPWTMVAPLAVLALFAAFAGFINTPFAHPLSDYLGQPAGQFNLVVMAVATVASLAGIGLGWALYRNAFASPTDTDPLERFDARTFRALQARLGFDQLYARTIGLATELLAGLTDWFDRNVLGRLVGGTGRLTDFLGRVNFILDDTLLNDGADRLAQGTIRSGDGTRRVATGKIQDYAALIFAGVVVLGVIFLYAGR